MITVEQIQTYFSYFYSKTYQDHKFKLRPTKATTNVCESFLKMLDKKYSLHCVGEQFLWDYFLFQFNYWHDLELQNQFTDKIIIQWIVGKKALERWEERDREFDWQMESYPIIKKFDLNQKDLKDKHLEKPKQSVPYDSNTILRKQFLNSTIGFAMCVQFTTLYNPKDFSCIKCQSKEDCKELLKANYPELFKKRGL